MNKLKRFYNQNRKTIFSVICFIAFIIIIIQLLNHLSEKNQENKQNAMKNASSNSITNDYKPNQSVIFNQEVEENTYKIQSNVIDEFIEYCNNGDIQNAYDLLADECKEEMFPTLEYFKANYHSKIFNTTKLYSIQNWNNSTYKIKITENILSTGKVNNGTAIEDYFTLVRSQNGYKLNINRYIGRKEINKEKEYQNIKIKILSKNTYMDYESYNIYVENKTENDILLDSKESTKSIYLKDSKDVEYPSYSHEIVNSSLFVRSGSNANLTIKFTNAYVSNREIKNVVFSDIILDYYKYKDISDKTQYKDRLKIEVKL